MSLKLIIVIAIIVFAMLAAFFVGIIGDIITGIFTGRGAA